MKRICKIAVDIGLLLGVRVLCGRRDVTTAIPRGTVPSLHSLPCKRRYGMYAEFLFQAF